MIDCCLPPPPPRSVDFKSQSEPSPVLSQLSQRQQHQTQAVTVPPPGLESFPSQVKLREAAPRDSGTSTVNKLLQLPSMTVENIAVSAHQPQPKHIKLSKSRRIPPASKVGLLSGSHSAKGGCILTLSSRGIFKYIVSWFMRNRSFLSDWCVCAKRQDCPFKLQISLRKPDDLVHLAKRIWCSSVLT